MDVEMAHSETTVRNKRVALTGVAGFIGSNLLEQLLAQGFEVVGLDNFSTGFRANLEEVRLSVGSALWSKFSFIEGDIRNFDDCRAAVDGCGVVFHQAALGSVPRSIDDPRTTNAVNVDGFLNILCASRDSGVSRVVYAASSSTYGDHPALPKREDRIGRPLSPYAITKYVNELYASTFYEHYGLETIGLRYFNVFGPRQSPQGAYAAVIPRWISAMLLGDPVTINGDGETSRDFCPVLNVVQANMLAAQVDRNEAVNEIYNVAVGLRTTLLELHQLIREILAEQGVEYHASPTFGAERSGDVRHSLADITKARTLLSYNPALDVRAGLRYAMPWYLKHLSGTRG